MADDEVVLKPVIFGSNPDDWYRYAPEALGEYDDDGTMVKSLKALSENIVGRKIVSAEKKPVVTETRWGTSNTSTQFVLELDDGRQVVLVEEGDCCAYTEIQKFLLHPDKIDHAITGVGTTDGFTKWHIFADFGDILELDVAWSCGNPFYYSYGFDIRVIDVPTQPAIEMPEYKATRSQE